jgi:hypothetical protein
MFNVPPFRGPADKDGDMTEVPRPEDLALIAIDAFNVFGFDPNQWPDVVQINRSGYTDINIRGIWSFEDRIEFFNAPLPDVNPDGRQELPTSPESSGSAE